MDLICVNCGALIADSDAACTGCGIPREASLPPGSVSAGPVSAVLGAPVVPEEQPQPQAPAPAYVDPQASYPPQYAYDPEPASAARSSIGATDVVVTVVAAALAFGLGWLVHGDLKDIQNWMVLRSVFGFASSSELSGHDLLVVLATFSPLAVGVLAALISRVPGTGFLVAAAGFAAIAINGNGPRVIGLAPEFDLDRDWVIGIALAGFAVADLILAFSGRGPLTGLLAGGLTGVVTAGFVTLYIQRIDSLEIFDEAWLIVLLLVVPTLLLLISGLIGGALGGLRRR